MKRKRPPNPLHCLMDGCPDGVQFVGRHESKSFCYIFTCAEHLPDAMSQTEGVYIMSVVWN